MEALDGEKRSAVRVVTNERITFVARQTPESMECQGVIINISRAGMGLYHYCSLREGDEIRIHNNLSSGCAKGVVRWVRRIDDVSGLAGVSCIEA